MTAMTLNKMIRKTRKHKRLVRQRSTTGTQTEEGQAAAKVNNNLVVHIERLKEDEVRRVLSKQCNRAQNSVRECRNKKLGINAIRHSYANIRQSLSRLPSNYSNFVRPINNNEVANSTVVNVTQNDEDPTIFTFKGENTDLDTARFIKPGPRSYKLKMLKKLETLRAPVGLSTPRYSEEDYLSIVPEAPDDNIKTSALQEVRVVVHEVLSRSNCVHTDDVLLAEDIDSIHENQDSNAAAEYKGRANSTEGEDIEDCNVNEDQQENNGSNSGNSKGDCNTEDSQNAKYIKISAHTVHIHNHFYKV